MRSTQWVDARKKPEAYCRRLRISDAADARWLQAAPEHLGVTQHYGSLSMIRIVNSANFAVNWKKLKGKAGVRQSE
jgi:hypothetical protein